jgi:hypothetical protein
MSGAQFFAPEFTPLFLDNEMCRKPETLDVQLDGSVFGDGLLDRLTLGSGCTSVGS